MLLGISEGGVPGCQTPFIRFLRNILEYDLYNILKYLYNILKAILGQGLLETSILKKVIFGRIKPPTETTCDPDTFFSLVQIEKQKHSAGKFLHILSKKKKFNKAIFTSYNETFLLGSGARGKPISLPTRHPQRRWIGVGVPQPP